MKKFTKTKILSLLSIFVFSAFIDIKNKSQNIVQYKYVKIGNQTWMAENLNEDRFRNGDIIPIATTKEEWIKATDNKQPAYCYYDNNPNNGKSFGKLYNRYAVDDPRGLAPIGWHISLDEEWRALSDYLGGNNNLGLVLKSETGWNDIGNGNNSLGFSGLPAGLRRYDGDFVSIGDNTSWWTGTDTNTSGAWQYSLASYNNDLDRLSGWEITGMSVRCVKD